MELHFWKLLWQIRLNRLYLLYAVLFGGTTLIIPFGVQYIVNNLALAGIWSNTIAFMLILSIGLLFSLFLNYGQFILREYLQRHVFSLEIKKWDKKILSEKAHYYFEVMSLMKSYATVFSVYVELGLVLIVGLITILLMHPYFMIFPFVIAIGLYFFARSVKFGVKTCILESDAKYAIFNKIKHAEEQTIPIHQYMENRDHHYKILKVNNTLALFLVFGLQVILLGGGIYLIETNQLSIGQFVSAEIIMSGVVSSILKLPKAMEEMFDFETSKYKLNYAQAHKEDKHV
jgi:hypothetical protein